MLWGTVKFKVLSMAAQAAENVAPVTPPPRGCLCSRHTGQLAIDQTPSISSCLRASAPFLLAVWQIAAYLLELDCRIIPHTPACAHT